jgi:cobalt/nickel transport system permease protein
MRQGESILTIHDAPLTDMLAEKYNFRADLKHLAIFVIVKLLLIFLLLLQQIGNCNIIANRVKEGKKNAYSRRFSQCGTMAGTAVVSVGAVLIAVRMVSKNLGEKQVPLMGILALLFSQRRMLNFPIAEALQDISWGRSVRHYSSSVGRCHHIDAVLVSPVFHFQDGGMLALGANIFNMGIVGGLGSYYLYRLGLKLLGDNLRSKMISGYFASWASVVLAATACSLELAISDASPLGVVLPAMLGVHVIIGLGEGAITVAALGLIRSTRADLLELQEAKG